MTKAKLKSPCFFFLQIQVVLNNKKNIFSSGISSVQIYKFAVKLFSQQVKFSLLLE
jgi:hypothetical protein